MFKIKISWYLKEKDDIFKEVAEKGTIYYNSQLFNEELFNNTNIENWEKNNIDSLLWFD